VHHELAEFRHAVPDVGAGKESGAAHYFAFDCSYDKVVFAPQEFVDFGLVVSEPVGGIMQHRQFSE